MRALPQRTEPLLHVNNLLVFPIVVYLFIYKILFWFNTVTNQPVQRKELCIKWATVSAKLVLEFASHYVMFYTNLYNQLVEYKAVTFSDEREDSAK